MTINEIKQKLAERGLRSRWAAAVNADALDLLDAVESAELPADRAAVHKILLNGAADWSAYSYGGCALVYNEDIARRYCTPSELRRVTRADGTISARANARESWLDVQARALWQAERLILDIIVRQ